MINDRIALSMQVKDTTTPPSPFEKTCANAWYSQYD